MAMCLAAAPVQQAATYLCPRRSSAARRSTCRPAGRSAVTVVATGPGAPGEGPAGEKGPLNEAESLETKLGIGRGAAGVAGRRESPAEGRNRQRREDAGVFDAGSKSSEARKKEEEEFLLKPWTKPGWDRKTGPEQTSDLYVAVLQWSGKAAYYSSFGLIFGWIVFRFVGPALGLYQLADDSWTPRP